MDVMTFASSSADYRTIEMAMRAFDERMRKSSEADASEEVSLGDEIAARLGLSRDHLDSLFARWAGLPLNRFLHCLSLSQTRKRLVETRNLLAVSLLPESSGTGNASLPEVWCRVRSLPSGQEKGQGPGKRGEARSPGLTIRYGCYPTPFGDCLLAMSGREICHLSFVEGADRQSHLEELQQKWPRARSLADAGEDGSQMVARIFAPAGVDSPEPLPLLLKGTDFQLGVWRALLALPGGALISYQDLAVRLGCPTACRAVAGAVAANPVAWLIPCHRVIRKSGEIHRYRWGSSRKKAMLGWEACRYEILSRPGFKSGSAGHVSAGKGAGHSAVNGQGGAGGGGEA